MNESEKPMQEQGLAAIKSASLRAELISQLNKIDIEIDACVCLLATYIAFVDSDTDDKFDDWYDQLTEDEHKLIKTFEVMRCQVENSINDQ